MYVFLYEGPRLSGVGGYVFLGPLKTVVPSPLKKRGPGDVKKIGFTVNPRMFSVLAGFRRSDAKTCDATLQLQLLIGFDWWIGYERTKKSFRANVVVLSADFAVTSPTYTTKAKGVGRALAPLNKYRRVQR